MIERIIGNSGFNQSSLNLRHSSLISFPRLNLILFEKAPKSTYQIGELDLSGSAGLQIDHVAKSRPKRSSQARTNQNALWALCRHATGRLTRTVYRLVFKERFPGRGTRRATAHGLRNQIERIGIFVSLSSASLAKQIDKEDNNAGHETHKEPQH